jgi:hypothetical protein
MLKSIISSAFVFAAFAANAQPAEDCSNMANRWSDVFTNAPALETMTGLFLPNALVFGTVSKELGTTTADVVAYFTPVFARQIRTKNAIKSQRAIQVSDGVWVIAGLYDFTNFAADGAQTVNPARFHFVVVRSGSQCKIAAFNSSRVPN